MFLYREPGEEFWSTGVIWCQDQVLVRSWKLVQGCGADTCEKVTAVISLAED